MKKKIQQKQKQKQRQNQSVKVNIHIGDKNKSSKKRRRQQRRKQDYISYMPRASPILIQHPNVGMQTITVPQQPQTQFIQQPTVFNPPQPNYQQIDQQIQNQNLMNRFTPVVNNSDVFNIGSDPFSYSAEHLNSVVSFPYSFDTDTISEISDITFPNSHFYEKQPISNDDKSGISSSSLSSFPLDENILSNLKPNMSVNNPPAPPPSFIEPLQTVFKEEKEEKNTPSPQFIRQETGGTTETPYSQEIVFYPIREAENTQFIHPQSEELKNIENLGITTSRKSLFEEIIKKKQEENPMFYDTPVKAEEKKSNNPRRMSQEELISKIEDADKYIINHPPNDPIRRQAQINKSRWKKNLFEYYGIRL